MTDDRDQVERLLAVLPPVHAPAGLHDDVMAALEALPAAAPVRIVPFDWLGPLSVALGAAVVFTSLRVGSWFQAMPLLREQFLAAIAAHPPSPTWWHVVVWAALGGAVALLMSEEPWLLARQAAPVSRR